MIVSAFFKISKNNGQTKKYHILFFLYFDSCLFIRRGKQLCECDHGDIATFDNFQESFKFETITIAPEDEVVANKAPNGMVFIKGGCFVLGNNFAQVDDSSRT